ncbi:MAG: hypothetical protein ACYDH0_10495 [Candidatus Aminicenantales bacterium]
MAIKRCPYCRAIIDEKEQYCNNCGTQLLFPDDEAVDEEIPGEKIIDADVEEKDYEIPEPGAELKEPEPDDEDEDVDDDGKSDEAEQEATGEVDEEVIVIDEDEKKPEDGGDDRPRTDDGSGEEPAARTSGKDDPRTGGLDEPDAAEAGEESAGEEPAAFEEEPEAEAPSSERPMTFDTGELDRIGRTAEIGKQEVDRFLDILKEKEEENRAMNAVPGDADEGLPPWANGMKNQAEAPATPMNEEETSDEEAVTGEIEEPDIEDRDIRPVPRVADSGIGLPEKVTQATLPFEPAASAAARAAAERAPAVRRPWPVERTEEKEEAEEPEEREQRERPPFRLSVFLKAKAFDALFVAVFWLISLWLAARAMEVTLFQMFGATSTILFVFYGALLVLYFFLFYFFLGETLGDRLFRDSDRI